MYVFVFNVPLSAMVIDMEQTNSLKVSSDRLEKLGGQTWDPLVEGIRFGAGGGGFESRPHHTKGVKNGTSSSLADARIKGVVLGR